MRHLIGLTLLLLAPLLAANPLEPLLPSVSELPAPPPSRSLDAWIEQEFVPSTLTPERKRAELRWLAEAAEPFRGMTLKVISENFPAHRYEANTLTRAFYDLTGIRVIHEITDEDDLIKKLQAQAEYDLPLYDGYINDSDLIGTHFRSGKILPLSTFMAGAGQAVTSPFLDLEDILQTRLTTAPDGTLYQLPDLTTLSLYWYRHDWFTDPELKQRFEARYGYPLGVPLNWAAYRDIAEFFTHEVREIDGRRVYGHFDYGKENPSLGWRFSDAWLSIAGTGDPGLPNGTPVDDWGIRAEGCHPAGASMARGGALNAPAAVHAIEQYLDWLDRFAPPVSRQVGFSDLVNRPLRDDVAQQIFWYVVFLPERYAPHSYLADGEGHTRWRVAPTPTGPYWQPGMKIGYQDASGWTFFADQPLERLQATWLYAQFLVSKTVSLKKSLIGFAPLRRSDLNSQTMTELAPRLGGLVEFFRSPLLEKWSSTGLNVPDYPGLASLWWKHLYPALSGAETVPTALDRLADAVDEHLAQLAADPSPPPCAPRLNPATSAEAWLARPGAPKPRIDTDAIRGRTRDPQHPFDSWSETP